MPWLNSDACNPNTRPTHRKAWSQPVSQVHNPNCCSCSSTSSSLMSIKVQLVIQAFFKESVQKWQQSSGSQFVSSWEPCLWHCSSLGGKQGQSAAACGGLWEPLTSDPLLWTSPEVFTSGGGRWCCRIHLYITRRPLLNCTAIQSRNCTFALRGTITFSCPHTHQGGDGFKNTPKKRRKAGYKISYSTSLITPRKCT